MNAIDSPARDAMLALARERSRGGYAAVIEIRNYLTGSSATAIATRRTRSARSWTRGGRIFVVREQFRDGQLVAVSAEVVDEDEQDF